jgi:hypothetical protein
MSFDENGDGNFSLDEIAAAIEVCEQTLQRRKELEEAKKQERVLTPGDHIEITSGFSTKQGGPLQQGVEIPPSRPGRRPKRPGSAAPSVWRIPVETIKDEIIRDCRKQVQRPASAPRSFKPGKSCDEVTSAMVDDVADHTVQQMECTATDSASGNYDAIFGVPEEEDLITHVRMPPTVHSDQEVEGITAQRARVEKLESELKAAEEAESLAFDSWWSHTFGPDVDVVSLQEVGAKLGAEVPAPTWMRSPKSFEQASVPEDVTVTDMATVDLDAAEVDAQDTSIHGRKAQGTFMEAHAAQETLMDGLKAQDTQPDSSAMSTAVPRIQSLRAMSKRQLRLEAQRVGVAAADLEQWLDDEMSTEAFIQLVAAILTPREAFIERSASAIVPRERRQIGPAVQDEYQRLLMAERQFSPQPHGNENAWAQQPDWRNRIGSMLNSPRAQSRVSALRVMQLCTPQERLPHLTHVAQLLTDPKKIVRDAAAELIAVCNHEERLKPDLAQWKQSRQAGRMRPSSANKCRSDRSERWRPDTDEHVLTPLHTLLSAQRNTYKKATSLQSSLTHVANQQVHSYATKETSPVSNPRRSPQTMQYHDMPSHLTSKLRHRPASATARLRGFW